jgi:two-component system sensor histidine kinase BaeS
MHFKIKYKLFATLLLTSGVIAASMFLFMQWSFDRGLLNYVNQQELRQLEQLSQRLTSEYARQGNWQFLQSNDRLWIQLHNEIFSPPHRGEHLQPRGRMPRGEMMPPPPEQRASIGPRIVLFDAKQKKLVGGGPHSEQNHSNLKPLTYQGTTIGYLSLAPAQELSDARDLLFVQQQTKSFALISISIVILSLLLSWPITNHLLRPIKALTSGARKLTSGYFDTRIPITTSDELGQLSADFNHLATTLEENKKVRQQWVADISHELRTPLAVLRGDIEALQDGIRQPDQHNLERLHSETMHLGRLIGDLYELSMSDIGALSYKKITVDPIGILISVTEQFKARFEEKKLTLTPTLPVENKFTLSADPDRLQQLFCNILENSLRYTNAPGKLNIHCTQHKNLLSLYFDDSAPAVEQEQLPKLFERLFRVESSRNRASGGAGLGLAICHNIVMAHNGQIAASSSKLGGLSITITLPLES